ncbi:MAG TPA: diadenylate cyclase, partial [Bacteroidales bacterium]|nr:diadenylate cyclase [Bacteroidales bacterium]
MLIETILPLFITFRWIDAIDIFLVALLLYEFYNLVKGTGAINIFIGIVAIIVLWKIVSALEMVLLSEILGAFISVGFIALIVVFQPEIRQFLLLLGNPSFIQERRRKFLFWRIPAANDERLAVDVIVSACQRMGNTATGALIVIAKTNELKEYVLSGEPIDSIISVPLLETIFFKNTPLHDGAAIIINNRIKAARCILPVSSNNKIPIELGLRHRAAIGVTERTDAIAL